MSYTFFKESFVKLYSVACKHPFQHFNKFGMDLASDRLIYHLFVHHGHCFIKEPVYQCQTPTVHKRKNGKAMFSVVENNTSTQYIDQFNFTSFCWCFFSKSFLYLILW